MASQLRWTSKSVDLLRRGVEISVKRIVAKSRDGGKFWVSRTMRGREAA